MAAKGRLRVTLEKGDGKVAMRLKGRLDGSGALAVERALKDLPSQYRSGKLLFDCQGVRHYEHFGMAMLARILRNERSRFRGLDLIGLEERMARVLKQLGLS